MLIVGLALALLTEAPAQAVARLQPQPVPRLETVRSSIPQFIIRGAGSTAAQGCRQDTFQRATTEPGALYVPGDDPARATRLTELPDADAILAVLRSADGRCELDVVRHNVSTTGRPATAPNSAGR